MKNIMKRAWEIYKTLNGTHLDKLSVALKKAWAEFKARAKETFEGFAKIAKINNPYSDCSYLTFKFWEKGSHKRIYINDYKRRTIGYINAITKEVVINDNQGNTSNEIDTAINGFMSKYAF